jgi:nucleoside-diphosphate-sugar epimerase
MLIAVTGGSGFLGAHTVARLVRRGVPVRVLARDPRRVPAALRPLGADPSTVDVVAGDVTDPAAVARWVAGADAVLHAAGSYTFDSRYRGELWRVNAKGTEVVLSAARRAGAARIVHVSTVGVLFPTTATAVGPASPVAEPRESYLASKAAAERIARAHQAEGAPVSITYPPALLGPDDPHRGDQNTRLRDLLRGLMPFWPRGGLPLGDVRDSARLHDALLTGDHPASGRYFGPGTFLTTADYVATARAVTGRRLPALFLPPRALIPVGRLADGLQRVWPWPLPAQYGAIYVCANAVPVAVDAPAGPGGARPVAETFRDTVAWLHATGHLSDRQAGTAALPVTADAGPGRSGTGQTQEVLP